MGLASGKTKLKLIDIESSNERDFSSVRASPSFDVDRASRRPVDAVTADGATEIGCALREARESAGQSLQDTSRSLRIRLEYLRAIENGDCKSLPGMTYAIGYVRTYAQHLDLDVERAISLFKAEASDLNGPRQLVFPSPAPEGKVPGGALMFVAAFLAIFSYAGWYYITDSGTAIAGYTLEVPEALQSWLDAKPGTASTSDGFTSAAVASSKGIAVEDSHGGPVESATPVAATSAVETPIQGSTETPVITASTIPGDAMGETPDGTTPVLSETEPASATSQAKTPPVDNAFAASDAAPSIPARPDQTVRPDPLAAAAANGIIADFTGLSPTPSAAVVSRPVNTGASIPQAPAMEKLETTVSSATTSRNPILAASTTPGFAGGARIIIQASAASWVQVRASDSTTVMTKVMRAGDIYAVPDRDGLRLFTGNAGALTILVDGKPIPKLGGTGQIARNIDLEPETLRLRIN
jgi:cytoskeleton protein RodZ